MRSTVAHSSLVLAIAIGFGLSNAWSNSYTLVDLGPVAPAAINNNGQIAANGGGKWFNRAKVYRGGKWHNLPPHSEANVLNENADAAGEYIGGGSNDFLMAIWPRKGEPIVIDVVGTLYGLNDSLQVAGTFNSGTSCFIWTVEAGFRNMGPMKKGDDCSAHAINNDGTITGGANATKGLSRNLFVWKNGKFRDLGKLPDHGGDTVGLAINNSGKVVGYATAAGGYEHPFLWNGSSMIELTAHRDWAGLSHATSINNLDEIVGTRFSGATQFAVRFADGKEILLSTEVVNLGEWELETATDINDDGVIVGKGNLGGYLLIPQK